MSPSKLLTISILVLALVVLAGCKGKIVPTPNYQATSTASARYYQTQAAESIARATSSAGGETPLDAGTFPFAACIIVLVVVGGVVFIFVQSRRRRSLR